MNKKKNIAKKNFIMSFISLVVCVAMLIGTTFAWFTDSVTSGINKIQAGNLDIELYHASKNVADTKVEDNVVLFDDVEKWEPGAYCYENFTIKNVGSLALKYAFGFNLPETYYNTVVEVDGSSTDRSLRDVLLVHVEKGEYTLSERPSGKISSADVTLKTFLENSSKFSYGNLAANGTEKISVVLYWPSDTDTSASALIGTGLTDNDYNLQNGKKASDAQGGTVGELYVKLGVVLNATQYTAESDSFDNMYDKDADGSDIWNGVTTKNVTKEVENASDEQSLEIKDNEVTVASVDVPAGVLDNDVTSLDLTVTKAETSIANPSVAVTSGNGTTTYEVELVDQNGNKVTATEDKPLTVKLNIGIVDLQKFYHKGTEMTASTTVSNIADISNLDVNTYYYDVGNGIIVYKTASLSPFTATYKYDGGLGSEEYPYLIDSVETWGGFANDAYSNYSNTEGKFYEVTTDLDFSNITKAKNVSPKYFAGNINFNGHTITGVNLQNTLTYTYNCLFPYVTGNATINCLEYELPNLGNDATVKVIGLVYGIGNVTVKNINMYGNLNMDDNNTGLLIYTVGNRFNGTITIDHCDNYCNMVNSGYSSAYVGRVYGENVHTTLIVNGCTNYGTIISTGKATSMILANPTRYSNNTLDLQISNCVNKGKIYAPEGQSTYLAMTLGSYGENCFYESGSLAEFETEGKIINADGGEAGSLKTGKISVTDDDKFDLNSAVSSIENATRFELSFGFNGTGGLGGGGVTNYTFIFEDKEHLVNIPAYTWINAEVASYIEEHNDYGTTYYTCGDNYVYNIPGCKMSSQPTVMLTTYDSNGDVLLVSYYTYDGVQ